MLLLEEEGTNEGRDPWTEERNRRNREQDAETDVVKVEHGKKSERLGVDDRSGVGGGRS